MAAASLTDVSRAYVHMNMLHCVCLHVYMDICVKACMHLNMYIYIYMYVYVYIYVSHP